MSSAKSNELNRILVVDDTAADRSLFKYVLNRAGFTVGVAVDGAEALSILSREDYDVVLCDYQMPNVDGYEFLLKVRQNPKLAHVIVIIITSDESDETKVKLMRAGANDFVHKGDSHDEIIKRMRVHLSAQAGQANRKTLELTCAMADNISQPLSILIATLYVLKDKIETEIPPGQKEELLQMVATLNKEADSMVTISEDIKKLSMDTRSSFEKDH
jgi:DNA-binding response OmpR family regulator